MWTLTPLKLATNEYILTTYQNIEKIFWDKSHSHETSQNCFECQRCIDFCSEIAGIKFSRKLTMAELKEVQLRLSKEMHEQHIVTLAKCLEIPLEYRKLFIEFAETYNSGFEDCGEMIRNLKQELGLLE